jgi:hypothetical protein
VGVELASRLKRKGIQVVLAGPNSKVLRNLERSGVLDEVGRGWVFSNVADAVDACESVAKVRVDGAGSSSSDVGCKPDLELDVSKDVTTCQLG